MAILTAKFWENLIAKQGFAIFFGVSVLAMIWQGGAWLGNNMLIPVRDGHLRFMDRVATSTETSAEGVQTLSDGVQSLSDSMERIEGKLSKALPGLNEECR